METVADDNALGITDDEWEKMRDEALDQADAEWEAKQAAADAGIEWPEKGEKISKSEYKDLMSYARGKGVTLSGFKQYDGDIKTIKDMIDDVGEIAEDFPDILNGKKSLEVWLDNTLPAGDFAVTRGHVISINANAFRNVERLEEEYQKLLEKGWFVSGTDYHSIIKHETGHVVANKYGYDGLKIAMDTTGIKKKNKLMDYVGDELSLYAASKDDGSEIISECFSGAYSSGETKNKFGLKIVQFLGML